MVCMLMMISCTLSMDSEIVFGLGLEDLSSASVSVLASRICPRLTSLVTCENVLFGTTLYLRQASYITSYDCLLSAYSFVLIFLINIRLFIIIVIISFDFFLFLCILLYILFSFLLHRQCYGPVLQLLFSATVSVKVG